MGLAMSLVSAQMGSLSAAVSTAVAQSCVHEMFGCGNVSQANRTQYLFLMFVSSICALGLRFYGADIFGHLNIRGLSLCTSEECIGDEVVYRISLSLALFFSSMALAQKIPATAKLHHKLSIVRFAIMIVCIVVAFVVSVSLVHFWVNLARYGSIVFLVAQIVVFIDGAYAMNQEVSEMRETPQRLVIVAVILANIQSAVMLILYYSWFTADETCTAVEAVITAEVVLILIWTLLSVSDRTQGSILVSTIVTEYSIYVLYSGLIRDPTSCNALAPDSTHPFLIAAGLLLTCISLTWSAVRMGNATSPQFESVGSRAEEFIDREEPEDNSASRRHDIRQANFNFHLVMVGTSMYMCMLLTDWSSVATNLEVTTRSFESMWSNIAAAWITGGLYIWTLIAPIIFPDREFD